MKILGVAIMLFALSACAAFNQHASGPAEQAASMPEGFALPEFPRDRAAAAEGTIYSERKSFDMYRDRRACQVGDLVLVRIVESSSGEKKAETKTSRSSSILGNLSNVFGFEQSIADRNPNFSPTTALKAGLTNSFDGSGETTRDSKVTATISARVIEVTMEGNLLIRGYREVRVNNETQYIILSGLVRPSDVSLDNSVLSTNIAEARIEYSGYGVISDKQQPGWLARVFDVAWPF